MLRSYHYVLFISLLVFGFQLTTKEEGYSERSIANHRECQSLIAELLTPDDLQKPKPKVAFKDLWAEFDQIKYQKAFESFDGLTLVELRQVEVPDNPEIVLAYLSKLSKEVEGIELDFASLGKLKRMRIRKLVDQLRDPGHFKASQIDDVLYDLIREALGHSVGFKEFLRTDSVSSKILKRALVQDLMTGAMLHTYGKYKLIKLRPNTLNKFIHSRLGKLLMTGFFNLPTLVGMPPLYIPRMGGLHVPAEITDKLLKNGISDKLIDEYDSKLRSYLVYNYDFTYNSSERINMLRPYYYMGLSVFMTYLFVDQMVSDDQAFEEEREIFHEMSESVGEFVQYKEGLEVDGIDLTVVGGDMLDVMCEAINECMQLDNFDIRQNFDQATYDSCKEIMDPDNRCQMP